MVQRNSMVSDGARDGNGDGDGEDTRRRDDEEESDRAREQT